MNKNCGFSQLMLKKKRVAITEYLIFALYYTQKKEIDSNYILTNYTFFFFFQIISCRYIYMLYNCCIYMLHNIFFYSFICIQERKYRSNCISSVVNEWQLLKSSTQWSPLLRKYVLRIKLHSYAMIFRSTGKSVANPLRTIL